MHSSYDFLRISHTFSFPQFCRFKGTAPMDIEMCSYKQNNCNQHCQIVTFAQFIFIEYIWAFWLRENFDQKLSFFRQFQIVFRFTVFTHTHTIGNMPTLCKCYYMYMCAFVCISSISIWPTSVCPIHLCTFPHFWYFIRNGNRIVCGSLKLSLIIEYFDIHHQTDTHLQPFGSMRYDSIRMNLMESQLIEWCECTCGKYVSRPYNHRWLLIILGPNLNLIFTMHTTTAAAADKLTCQFKLQ